MNFIPFLQAQPQAGSSYMTILMFALIFVIFYFFIIRPQNKKQKETEKMINALKKGDKIITIGGIHGEVSAVREAEKTIVIKVEDGSKIEFSRNAIASVVVDEPEKNSKKVAKADKKIKDSGENNKEGEAAAVPSGTEAGSEKPEEAAGQEQK